MVQPDYRRFVMMPRLDAEVEQLNDAIALKADLTDPRLSDQRVPTDNSVTSAKIVNGTIVDEDVSATAAIANTKVQGTIPTGGAVGQVLAKSTTTNFETTWVDGTALPASQVKQLVKNETGSVIPKGAVVYISGANGTNILISLADADAEGTSSKTIGLTETAINNGASGYVITEGILTGLNTATATAGQSFWLSTVAGEFVFNTPPAKPAHAVYLGVVSRANANNGEVFIKVQNGYELNELHDVNINAGTVTNGQALTYADGLWVNSTPVNALAGLSDVTISGLVPDQVLKYNGTKWVNSTGGGGASVVISDTAPTGSSEGDMWLDSTDFTLNAYYEDADGGQWVQVKANSGLAASFDARLSTVEAEVATGGSGVIKLNPNVLSTSYTIPSGFNGMSAGPVTIADGVVVTIPDGSAWSIV